MALKSQDIDKMRLISQFTFVDLAGSEKLVGEHDINRINEAKYINKSLSSLGIVIQALKVQHEKSKSEALGGASKESSMKHS